MKRYAFITLKVLLVCILTFSVFRLASLGAGLVRDRDRFEELQSEMYRISETVSEDRYSPVYVSDTDHIDNTGQTVRISDTVCDKAEEDTVRPTGYGEIYKKNGDETQVQPEDKTEDKKYFNIERFAPFTERNPDFAGWLKIEGTEIDYPVMYSPEDPDFYLHHDFDKNDSKSGVPYIGRGCVAGCDNTIIYAHNMKSGTMFAGLLKYSDEEYYKSHPEVNFDTLTEDGIYDIIAVFREKVHFQDEQDVFRYYNYCGELSEIQFYDYIKQIKNIALYDTGKTAVYGQKLITLSTCAYHTDNGRFVVVAVERQEEHRTNNDNLSEKI